MKNRVFAAFFLFTLLIGQIVAQGGSDLDKLDEMFSRYFEKVMPAWKHERVEPIVKTENVLIQFWSFSNRKVKISIIPRKSTEEARDVLHRYAKYESKKEQLTDVGDEAYASGYGFSDVAFRRGRLTIYVRATADVDSDPDARTLSQSERFEREKSEMRRLSREFARHAVKAIDTQ